MKLIHLTAGLACFLLSSFTTPSSAATRGAAAAASPVIVIPDGDKDVPGDFNEDSNPDLLFQNRHTGELGVWLMSRTRPVDRVRVSSPGDPSRIAVGTDDFDGDNRTDVVFWDPRTGDLTIWYMDGLTLIRKEEVHLENPGYAPVSIFDHNRDGSPDVLFQGKGGDLQMVLFSGSQVIAKQRIDLVTPTDRRFWRVVGSGDFDGDADDDLVLVHDGTMSPSPRPVDPGHLAVALMDGNTGHPTLVTELRDRNWQIGAVADYTRNGWPDLFWENVMTGATAVWEMQGLKIVSAYVVTGPSSGERGWHMVGPR